MGAADFKFFRVILKERNGGTFNIVGLIRKIVERIKVSVIKWALVGTWKRGISKDIVYGFIDRLDTRDWKWCE